MEFLSNLTDGNVGSFLLLLLRFAGVLAFFPFFDNTLVPISIRAALTLFMTLLFYPLVPYSDFNFTLEDFLIAGAMEIMLGFIASLVLQIVFGAIAFAGESISFSMGFTIASAYDPMTGAQKPIIGQAISILAIVIALGLDFHHQILAFVSHTLTSVPLGGFVMNADMLSYLTKAFANLFLVGFTMAFPILGLVLMSDIIFGMIMKTHPQFNLLAIGFPVKIAIALVVIAVIIPAIMLRFKNELNLAFLALSKLF